MLRPTHFLAVWLAAPSLAVSSSSSAAPMRMLQEPASDAVSSSSSKTDGLAATVAPTTPMRGVDIEIDWARSTVTALPRSACAPLAASIHRHTIWFEGAQESFEKDASAYLPSTAPTGAYPVSNQQSGQRAFLQRVSTELCARPSQSEDEYTTILHSMLDEVRTHIARHVHSAFWVKSICAGMQDNCFDASALRELSLRTLEPDALKDGYFNVSKGTAADFTCMAYILEHEKYNLAEGFTFANISYSLLSRGAAFCTDPRYETTLAAWHAELEAAMEAHKCNHLFGQMLKAHNNMLCTAPDEYEGQYQEIYNAVAQQIDADVLGATTPLQGESEAPNTCTIESIETSETQGFMKSNPPDAADLLHVFSDNTNKTVAAAIYVADTVLAREGCVDQRTNATDWRTARALRDQLHATLAPSMDPGGAAVTYDQLGITQNVAKHIQDYLALPTVYHKLMLMCWPNSTASNLRMCAEGSGAAVVDPNPVFDIVTTASLASCRGEACRSAARAVLKYNELLNVVTPLRWDTIRIFSGMAPLTDDIMTQGSWTLQRSCPALRNVVTNAAKVRAQLPEVMSDLYSAEPHLTAACISGGRDIDESGELGSAASRVLGASKSKENAGKWANFLDRMVGQC